jgi:GNAT superfamily N-acetyltransferase
MSTLPQQAGKMIGTWLGARQAPEAVAHRSLTSTGSPMAELTKPRPSETVLWMWTRTATLEDLAYCLTADAFVGVTVDRTKHLQSALADRGCFVGGRFQDPEGVLISGETFFSRPFVSLLVVEEHARRCGLASALLMAAEAKYAGRHMFTPPINQIYQCKPCSRNVVIYRPGYFSTSIPAIQS